MNPQAAADTAVLVSAIVTLVAIASKLITANLLARTKKKNAQLEARRRETASRLKEVQLKTTSARGTLEFWERRRTETQQRLADAERDVETHQAEMGAEPDGDDEDVAMAEGAGEDDEAGASQDDAAQAPADDVEVAAEAEDDGEVAAEADDDGEDAAEADDDGDAVQAPESGEAADAPEPARPDSDSARPAG